MAQSLIGAAAPTLAIVDGIPTTTSHEVAQHFAKEHAKVLRSIELLREANQAISGGVEFNARNFAAVETTDAKGEKRPAYRLTRDGFTLLAMGFTGKRALAFKLAYIEAFNRMEAALRQPQPTAAPKLPAVASTTAAIGQGIPPMPAGLVLPTPMAKAAEAKAIQMAMQALPKLRDALDRYVASYAYTRPDGWHIEMAHEAIDRATLGHMLQHAAHEELRGAMSLAHAMHTVTGRALEKIRRAANDQGAQA